MKPSMKINVIIACAALFVCLAAPGVSAQGDQSSAASAAAEKYGSVHFPVSCTPAAQEQFDRAVSMLHSFFFPETIKAFTKVAEIDPNCAMAYWGIAISQRPNPLVPPFSPAALKQGYEAVEKGKAIGPKTQREADWLNAMELFFKDSDKLDQKTRGKLYRDAMEKLYLRYPDDTEAAVFYALAILENASPTDKTYADQLKAAAILQKIEAREPNHPGVVHYLIHAYDFQPLAAQGLPFANRYAMIAPSAPHALHMPSHIYSMLGMWEESIKANKAAEASANAYAAEHYPGATNPQALHCMDFMEYAYLQLGEEKEAKAIVDRAAAVTKVPFPGLSVDNALAAIPARYALERGAWPEAAALEPRPGASPYATSITYFARTLGHVKTGNAAGAEQDAAQIKTLLASYAQKPEQQYWAGQTQVLLDAALAWLALAQGKKDEAVKGMRSAADLEDSSEKSVAMENRLFPMRELLGYMLLETGHPGQALAEFEASLKAKPNRLRGFYGAAKAAEALGDETAARAWYEKLAKLTQNGSAGRAEVVEAKAFLAGKE